MSKFFVILCLLILNTLPNAFASGTAKLVDFMISGSGIIEILGKYGIKDSDAKLVESYMLSSLTALGAKKTLTKEEFKLALDKLPMTGKDALTRKELQTLLDKSENEISKDDIVKAINHIIYLADRHGKSVIITCAECVNENLAKNGFKFTVENIKNASSIKVLNEVLPKNPDQLSTFISARMRRMALGDYAKVTPDQIAPSEEKSFALFLALMESGSTEQKELISSIKKLSTKNGKTNLLDPKNPQKFWKIMADDMSPQDMQGWTKTLDEVSARADQDGVSSEEAFYRTLKEKAQGNEFLMKKYETLKTRRCFFK